MKDLATRGITDDVTPKIIAAGRWSGQLLRVFQRPARAGLMAIAFLSILAGPMQAAKTWESLAPSPTRHQFRHHMARTVRADHPVILPVAAAIRAITTDPREQLVMVNDVTHLLVEYDDDDRVYGKNEYHATLEEMLARRRQAGWLYLRDDCDGRAIFAAHLLSALGIPWRLEASYWKGHAWVVAQAGGREYDLLDQRPKEASNRLSQRLIGQWIARPSHRPPSFDWRRRWREKTGKDLTLGFQLGLLNLDSTADSPCQRFSTDWSKSSPGLRVSPPDDRAFTAAFAGFPYGEPLRAEAWAANDRQSSPPTWASACLDPELVESVALRATLQARERASRRGRVVDFVVGAER